MPHQQNINKQKSKSHASILAFHVHINPLDAMDIFLNQQKFMYKVLAPSIITPNINSYGHIEALDMFVSMVG